MSDNQNYLIGSRRVRPVFLWFPRRLSGELRFFGWHRVCQEYRVVVEEYSNNNTPNVVVSTRSFAWVDDHWYTLDDVNWGMEKYPMGDDR